MNFGILDCRLMVLAGPAIIRILGLQFLRRVVIAGLPPAKCWDSSSFGLRSFFFCAWMTEAIRQ